MQHHERALADFASTAMEAGALAVVLTGSVARGTERPDSDVDVYLIVGREAFARARAESRVSYVVSDGVEYPGGYLHVDVA
ncbi:nucleotidyltransferase domain-containing protein, partial [Rhizobium johnstonii]|uniref:nucleotidyltransferase domain-containing protein n=1 Tax=Rhizobium johnstonii TaxID=3019933 RepID=UPI003F9805FB